MPGDKRQPSQPGCDIGPEVTQGEMLCGQLHDAGAPLLLPSLIAPQAHAQFFSCTLLRPFHTLAPQLQLETTHIPIPQIIRNSPGEILVDYEKSALCAVCGGGWYGR